MLYAIFCTDRPGMHELRLATRPAHLDYVYGPEGKIIKFGGPMTTEDGAMAIGGFIIVEADSYASAESFALGDPFAKAGLSDTIVIKPWRWSFNNPDD